MHLAYLHEWKGFYAARYPMHQQDLPTRRSIIPHSEGVVFISWHPSQGALFVLSGRFGGRLSRHHYRRGAPLLLTLSLSVSIFVRHACKLVT